MSIISRNYSDGSDTDMEFVPEIPILTLAKIKSWSGDELTEDEINNLPKQFSIKVKPSWKKWKHLPDSFNPSHYFLFSERLHDHIQTIEPNTHRFTPIEVITNKPFLGKTVHPSFYLMISSPPRVDCIAHSMTNEIKSKKDFANWDPRLNYALYSEEDTCAIHAKKIEGRHIWQLPKLWIPKPFISDELMTFYKKEGMKGWAIFKQCTAV